MAGFGRSCQGLAPVDPDKVCFRAILARVVLGRKVQLDLNGAPRLGFFGNDAWNPYAVLTRVEMIFELEDADLVVLILTCEGVLGPSCKPRLPTNA